MKDQLRSHIKQLLFIIPKHRLVKSCGLQLGDLDELIRASSLVKFAQLDSRPIALFVNFLSQRLRLGVSNEKLPKCYE